MTLILPSHRPRLLVPVPKVQWYKPSAAQPKDQFGNDTLRTIFRLTARLSDGHVTWRGIFRDRDDADAFLWAMASGALHQEPALWRLPVPHWHPDIAPFAIYDFATTDLITSTNNAANQTYNVPADWVDDGSVVEVVSHGGNGGAEYEVCCESQDGEGGGGGGYAKATNVDLTPSGTATFHLEAGGQGDATTDATWFNGATLAASSVGIRGATNAVDGDPGNGASTTNAVGSVKRAGGAGSNSTSGGGGGGAAGPDAVGGDASGATGGARGSGSFADGNTHNGAGGNANANGNNYGGGGGGQDDVGGVQGTGAQGIIVVTYTPAGGGGNFFLFF